MSPDPTPPDLDPAVRTLILRKARQVVRRGRFSRSDLPDVEQALTAHVWPRLGRFDPARADRDVFVRMLVGHAAATALRTRRLRDRPATVPLGAARVDDDLPDDRAWPAPEQATGLALDIETVLAGVTQSLRWVARAVGAEGSVAAAARDLGISRSTLYRRLRDLRAAFEVAGFGDAAVAPGSRLGGTRSGS